MFFTLRAGPVVNLYFSLHAVFDATDCRLYGTAVIPYVGARNELSWAVEDEGTRISGVFNIRIGTEFMFPANCMNIGVYGGEATDDTILSVLANAGYPYLNTTT